MKKTGLAAVTMALGLTLCSCLSMAEEVTYLSGSYTGEAQGFGGVIKVVVTVSQSEILSVVVEGEAETAGVGTRAIEALPAQIMAAQSAQVDVVAGATVSSKALTAAAADALMLAQGFQPTCEAYAFTPGTYEAKAEGFGGGVKATVTVDATDITEIILVGLSETTGVGTLALEQLPAKIVEAQGTKVDVVTGATVTSQAVFSAVNAALDLALVK